ncbi:MAG: LytTR family DNA-binding domain-containing protein [Acidobacteriota bacterium]|nr:LytTR family DNA-binding domain-containing protein [Acidobacteriota bacterium]
MNVLIVEDEAVIARRIQRLLTEVAGDRVDRIRTAGSFDEAKDWLDRHPVDLLFLDLNLNGRDGFDILKRAVARSFHTVVISAHTERALEAFEHGVLDFLGKPFGPERLKKALDRFFDTGRRADFAARYLSVRKHTGLVLIPLAEIRYLKGANTYAELHLEDGRTELHAKSLEKISALLPACFERVHKSYIVDMNRVKELRAFTGSRYELVLDDGATLPVGRTRYKVLKEKMG